MFTKENAHFGNNPVELVRLSYTRGVDNAIRNPEYHASSDRPEITQVIDENWGADEMVGVSFSV